MAFPVREATATTRVTTGDPHTVNLPASIAAGDVLLLHAFSGSTRSPSTPTGWTALLAGASEKHFLYYKVADGGEGTTLSFTWNASTAGNFITSRWSGASGTVEAARTNSSSNPPSLTPSWGAADTEWVTSFGYTGSTVAATAPTNYGDAVHQFTSFDFSLSLADRDLNATSEDPGAWSGALSGDSVTTAAIEPGGGAPAPTEPANVSVTFTLATCGAGR